MRQPAAEFAETVSVFLSAGAESTCRTESVNRARHFPLATLRRLRAQIDGDATTGRVDCAGAVH
jgi:hypothetical protein